MPTSLERAWALFIPRGIAGFMFLFAGANKVFRIGPLQYADRVGDHSHMTHFFPWTIVTHVAAATGFVELVLGAMLLLGVGTRWAARLLGAMMVMVAAGYGLAGLIDPVGGITAMDIRAVNTYILPRTALLILILMLPEEDDLFTLPSLVGMGRGQKA
jgi:uncharacterized membrane protein YphA (DoxX/SURF4 family)